MDQEDKSDRQHERDDEADEDQHDGTGVDAHGRRIRIGLVENVHVVDFHDGRIRFFEGLGDGVDGLGRLRIGSAGEGKIHDLRFCRGAYAKPASQFICRHLEIGVLLHDFVEYGRRLNDFLVGVDDGDIGLHRAEIQHRHSLVFECLIDDQLGGCGIDWSCIEEAFESCRQAGDEDDGGDQPLALAHDCQVFFKFHVVEPPSYRNGSLPINIVDFIRMPGRLAAQQPIIQSADPFETADGSAGNVQLVMIQIAGLGSGSNRAGDEVHLPVEHEGEGEPVTVLDGEQQRGGEFHPIRAHSM